jgi:hypothetical protein
MAVNHDLVNVKKCRYIITGVELAAVWTAEENQE